MFCVLHCGNETDVKQFNWDGHAQFVCGEMTGKYNVVIASIFRHLLNPLYKP
jgi:hypothetical protein